MWQEILGQFKTEEAPASSHCTFLYELISRAKNHSNVNCVEKDFLWTSISEPILELTLGRNPTCVPTLAAIKGLPRAVILLLMRKPI